MSIYREEALDTLISCLRNSDYPAAQLAAAKTIVSLQGRFTTSGKSLTRAMLLKHAGLGKRYKNLTRTEQIGNICGEADETSVSRLKNLRHCLKIKTHAYCFIVSAYFMD